MTHSSQPSASLDEASPLPNIDAFTRCCLFLLVCSGALSSCRSAKVAARVLPYHVAVLPLRTVEASTAGFSKGLSLIHI